MNPDASIDMSKRDRIIIHATRLAAKIGYRDLTRAEVATAANVATGTVSYHFGTLEALQDAIVEHAVQHEVLAVVAQALADNHKAAVDAPAALKQRAARYLAAR